MFDFLFKIFFRGFKIFLLKIKRHSFFNLIHIFLNSPFMYEEAQTRQNE